MKRIRESDFYIAKPKALGWRGASLLVPALFSGLGFCAFAILAFSFTEMAVLGQMFKTALVLIGSISLAIGGELGTLSNTVEVFRKNGKANAWDWSALCISVLSTLAGFLLAFSALLGVTSTWAGWMQVYGPIVLGLLCALDSYFNYVETGMYLSTFDERMKTWREQFEQYKRDEYAYTREQQKVLVLRKRTNQSRANRQRLTHSQQR